MNIHKTHRYVKQLKLDEFNSLTVLIYSTDNSGIILPMQTSNKIQSEQFKRTLYDKILRKILRSVHATCIEKYDTNNIKYQCVTCYLSLVEISYAHTYL